MKGSELLIEDDPEYLIERLLARILHEIFCADRCYSNCPIELIPAIDLTQFLQIKRELKKKLYRFTQSLKRQ